MGILNDYLLVEIRECKMILPHGRMIVAHGRMIVAHGRMIVAHGRTIVAHGRTIVAHGRTIVAHGRTIVAHGRMTPYSATFKVFAVIIAWYKGRENWAEYYSMPMFIVLIIEQGNCLCRCLVFFDAVRGGHINNSRVFTFGRYL